MDYAAVLEKLKADERTSDLFEKRNSKKLFDPYAEQTFF
ncbi:hypothetical protein HNQ40_003377 [Algisphaera agarilytica]|uniref:Uncharacterized protein n=1 Tax=Algisphaera agarilytica TaxID=1385975 RepID=A0A7X0HBA0_9BACT|nr:hypothetical protein [Algisphaera agarilytica]